MLNDPLYKPIIPLIRDLPVTWDSTIVLPQSKMGSCAIIAKKHGRDWYVAAINGGNKELKIQLDVSFIRQVPKYKATLITDYDNGFKTSNFSSEQLKTMKVTLAPQGGFVMCLTPAGVQPSAHNINATKHKISNP
ncbi:glycoside hydrolase family 97 C-terminal domain-containing protein [Niabella hibiscisoli]|uniref:glycoside hydrolase family 97 C-terminal domain-containing protein n=1 Tax=Niabella hibiscisoli TaxID=1825928 RepID=UPI001F0EE5C1|nr:glycoside hydrolase family 97 C-terminal domain-containing protein [Niabella hibiscisoli]MCH5719505.1 glycoside hydrolase family 97 C-terminal domain-containing protein [Niabella hibiscisoli]